MISIFIFQVMSFYLLPSVNGSGNDNCIVQTPGAWPMMRSLKNAQVWMDERVTSLNDILGPDTETWTTKKDDDCKIATKATLSALGCNYGKTVARLFQAFEHLTARCAQLKEYGFIYPCLDRVKRSLNTHHTAVLNMISTILYYSESWNVRFDRNLLKTFLALQLFFLNRKFYEPPGEIGSVYELQFHRQSLKTQRTVEYIRYTLDNFAADNCVPSSFPISNNLTEIREKCSCSQDTADPTELIQCFQDRLTIESTQVLPFESIQNDLAAFYPENFMLKHMLDFELIPGNRMGNVQSRFGTVDDVYDLVVGDTNSERVLMYQSLVIECVGSVAFYLISNFIAARPKRNALNSADCRIINDSLQTLNSLNPAGAVKFTLKEIQYKRTLQTNEYDLLTDSIDSFFSNTHFKRFYIEHYFSAENTSFDSSETGKLLELLGPLMQNVREIRPFLFTTTLAVDEYDLLLKSEMDFPDIIYRDFQTHADLQRQCGFSLHTIKHFVLTDAIVSQCKALAVETLNSDSGKKSTGEIHKCFSRVNELGRLISAPFMQFYGGLIKNKKIHHMKMPGKFMDVMFAFLMYLNNSELFDITGNNDDNITLTDIISKANALTRSHRIISNRLENFSSEHCSVLSARKKYTEAFHQQLETRFQNFNNEPLLNVDFIGKQIAENIDDVPLEKGEEVEMNNGTEENSENSIGSDEETLDDYEFFNENLNFNFFTFENVITNYSSPGQMFSFINQVKVLWDDQCVTIKEAHRSIGNKMSPRYLMAYQMLFVKVIYHAMYERIKDIVRKITHVVWSDESYMEPIGDAFEIIEPILQPYHRKITTVIFYILEETFGGDDDDNKSLKIESLIAMIEKEQSELGIQCGSIDENPESVQNSAQVQTPQHLDTGTGQNEINTESSVQSIENDFIRSIDRFEVLAESIEAFYSQFVYFTGMYSYARATSAMY